MKPWKTSNFRKDEGASLEKEFQLRIGNIVNLMNEAVSYDAERVETIKTVYKLL
jgi:hypothetical protein